MACPHDLAAAAAAPPACAGAQLQFSSRRSAAPVPEEELLNLPISIPSSTPSLDGVVGIAIPSPPQYPASDEFSDSLASSNELPQTMGERVSGWATRLLATWQMLIVIALFPISMETLLQTDLSALFPLGSNLVAPVLYCLVINVVASFIFFLLHIMPEDCSSDPLHVTCATHMCFGLAVLAMGIALTMRLIGGHAI